VPSGLSAAGSDPGTIAMAFHAAINARDLDALSALMTPRHRFIDSAGSLVDGKEACRKAWRGFFDVFPDYANDVSELIAVGSVAVMAGSSRCSDPRLDGPALWRAVADRDKLSEWRVYPDTAENRTELGLTS
jgi:ketosteroid isomerase-like protein